MIDISPLGENDYNFDKKINIADLMISFNDLFEMQDDGAYEIDISDSS